MRNILHRILLLCSITYGVSACCKTRIAPCNENPIAFHRNTKCALRGFEEVSSDFTLKLKSTVNIAEKVTVGIDDFQIQRETKDLKEKLTNRTISIRDAYKAAVILMVNNPCGASAQYAKIVENLSSFTRELDQLSMQFENQLKMKELEIREKEIGQTLNDYLYQRGKREGTAVGKIARLLDNYYQVNKKYPNDISEIDAINEVNVIRSERLQYKIINDDEYSLTIAGEDYVLGTADDMVTKGIKGKSIKG